MEEAWQEKSKMENRAAQWQIPYYLIHEQSFSVIQ
jgi:hypothetical protein